jgi:signal transduction histidine kinase
MEGPRKVHTVALDLEVVSSNRFGTVIVIYSPLSVLIRAIDEVTGVLSLAVLCLFSRHPKNWFISSAAVVYASSFYVIRTSGRHSFGEDALCVRTSALAVIAVAFLFVTTDKRGLTTEQLGVSGHLLGLLVFHFALFRLQSSAIVPEEVATLCYSLVAGWVRYNVTVLSCGGDDTAVILATARPCDDSTVPIRQRPKLPPLVIDEPQEDHEEDEEDTEVHELATARSSVHKELNKFQLVHRADESELFKHMHSESVDMFEGREASSRRKLLRYVFHEMRAPLNAISMAVELLTNQYKTGATPKSRKADLETLQMIEEASLTMERTLKDSMTLQRIEEGLLVPQVKIFSVHEMCDDIHDALMLVLRSSSVRFAYSVDPAVPVQLVGDHFRLRHVVAHVVSNGIKYSRPGDVVRMRVTLGPRTQAFSCDEDEGGGVGHEVEGADGERISLTVKASENVVFSISDQGVGMSAELQASDIFKPFSTLKTDELKNFRGSGLGLAICKKIMHFLQGAISYNSVPNEGTTFTVTYPLTRLDKNSMDEYDSDCDESGPATVGTYSGSFYSPTCTPETTRRKIALTRAKSFRGQRLFNIMQTPSSVFECPTPKSNIPSPMRSDDPSDHQEILHTQSDHRLASIDEADCEYSPRPGDADSPTSSSNPPSPERVSLVDPPPRRPSFQGSPRFATKRLSARTLSINTHTGSLVDRESNYNSVASSFRSDAAPELLASTERSMSSDGEGDHPVSRHNSEYAALTEKNVNLHILRSASTDVACVLQVQGAPPRARVSSGRLPLVEMLSACKVLVVDG